MNVVLLEEVVASLESGARPPGGVSACSGEIPSVGGEHLTGSGGFDFTSIKRIPRIFYERMRSGQIAARDILVVKDGATTGKTSFVGVGFPFPEAAVNEHVFRVRVDQSKASPEYVFHFLRSPFGQSAIALDFRGATVGGISRAFARKVRLPLPPLPEQRRIAEILDKADALRAKRRAALAQLNALTQSIFLDMFGDPATNPKGWPQLGMQDAVVGRYGIKAGPFGSSLKKSDYTTCGYRVYGQEQVIARRFDVGDYYIGERKYRQLRACTVVEGDVLLSLVGSFGKVLVVTPGIEPGIINPRLLKITPNQGLLSSLFLATLLELPETQATFERMAHGGTMGILNAGLLKQLQVILPPVPLQRTFADRVRAVEESKAAYSASLIEINTLFASLQHRAFRGEL